MGVGNNDQVLYVGRGNFGQRVSAHRRNPAKSAIQSYRKYPGLSESLSRSTERGVEQVLMERYGLDNLLNKINSIARSSKEYKTLVARGKRLLDVADSMADCCGE